ncbi:MAG: DUF2306 domain-containing protein [Pseudomonadota bacterium]
MSERSIARAPGRLTVWVGMGLLGIVLLLASDFITHSLELGWQGLSRDLSGESRLYWPDAPVATGAIFVHMIGGAVITALAPVQLAGPVRRRWPALHRWSGRVLVGAALLTGVAGLVYIGLRGTIGGWDMSLSFALYGICVLVAAGQALRFARAGAFARHRRWGLRLAVLALGSWIYRMQYALWFMTTGGIWVERDFSGAFDLVNIWAFYVPYLIALELWFRYEARRGAAVAAG